MELLAEAVHTSKSTIERRLKAGGWTAREVAAVAWAFGVSVDQLYSGAVDFNASQWLGSPVDPTAPRDGAGRPPTVTKVAHQRRLVSVSASPRRQTSLSVSRPRLQLITA